MMTWDEFTEKERRNALQRVVTADAFIAAVPSGDVPDERFALKLGMAVMLDKPIFVIAKSADDISTKLGLILSDFAILDTETEEGQIQATQAIDQFLRRLAKGVVADA